MSNIYLGVDVDKNYSSFTALHQDGRIFKFDNHIINTYEAVSQFLNFFGKKHSFRAVLETGRNWELCMIRLPRVENVKVANPFKVKANASTQLKTDKVDAEALAEKPSFLKPFQTQRCLVIADGFYEWRKETKKKTPLAIKLKNNRPFTFAGLYDRWQSSEGDIITSCTIITTESNQLLAPIHNRMPVILPKNTYDIWLDKNLKDTNQLMDLLVPYDDDKMQTYPISPMVPSPKNNSPNLIKPLGKSALL